MAESWPGCKKCFDRATRVLQGNNGAPSKIGFSSALQNLSWDNARECSPHERTPPSWPDELLSRDCIHEFGQTAIETGIALLARQGRQRGIACQLPSQGIQRSNVFLKRREWAKKLEPDFIPLQGHTISFDEVGIEPRCGLLKFRDANQGGRGGIPGPPQRTDVTTAFFY